MTSTSIWYIVSTFFTLSQNQQLCAPRSEDNQILVFVLNELHLHFLHTWSFTKGHSDAEKYGNLYPVTIVHWVEIYVCSMWDQNSISKAFGKGWISHLEYVLK